jgi:hypothetical protein
VLLLVLVLVLVLESAFHDEQVSCTDRHRHACFTVKSESLRPASHYRGKSSSAAASAYSGMWR